MHLCCGAGKNSPLSRRGCSGTPLLRGHQRVLLYRENHAHSGRISGAAALRLPAGKIIFHAETRATAFQKKRLRQSPLRVPKKTIPQHLTPADIGKRAPHAMAGSDKIPTGCNNKSCILTTRHTHRGDACIYVEMDEEMLLDALSKSLSTGVFEGSCTVAAAHHCTTR